MTIDPEQDDLTPNRMTLDPRPAPLRVEQGEDDCQDIKARPQFPALAVTIAK